MKQKHKIPPWLRPKTSPSNTAICVAWYTEEEWGKVKNFAVDAEIFEDKYKDWLDAAERVSAELKSEGVHVIKQSIVADELKAWCLVHGKMNEASTRAEFVARQ